MKTPPQVKIQETNAAKAAAEIKDEIKDKDIAENREPDPEAIRKKVSPLPDNPKVSFLVPVYNVQDYLPKCLDSLLGQSWKNIEIVLINDGSKDHSRDVALSYMEKHDCIHLYEYANAGISKTRNRALKHATGDLYMFVDSDDFIDPDMVSKMIEVMKQEDLDIIQCGFVMDYRFGSFYRPGAGHKMMSGMEALHALSQGKWFNNYPWGKLYKAELFEGVRFPEDQKGFEDTFTIFKAFAHAYKAGTIPNRFYHYVQRRGSLTNRMSLDTVYTMREAYQYQQDWLKEHFPKEVFSYDLQQYNTDMVLIYTLIVFVSRKDQAGFTPYPIDWSKLPVPVLWHFGYWAWLQIALLKLGRGVLVKEK